MSYILRTKDEKLKIVADVEALIAQGKNTFQACRELNIYRSMYDRWRNGDALGDETSRRTPEQIEELKRKWLEAQGTGMDMAAFCRAENVSYSAMYGYMNKRPQHRARKVKKERIERKVNLGARTIVPVESSAEKELKTLREENTQLKLMVAELCLDRKSLIAYAGR